MAQGYSLSYGARFLKRTIDERIKLPISANWKDGSHFRVVLRDGELVVDCSAARLVDTTAALAYDVA